MEKLATFENQLKEKLAAEKELKTKHGSPNSEKEVDGFTKTEIVLSGTVDVEKF